MPRTCSAWRGHTGSAASSWAAAESARSGERWLDAETWRTKAALLRLQGAERGDVARSEGAARACLATAIRIARAQGAAALVRRAEADGGASC